MSVCDCAIVMLAHCGAEFTRHNFAQLLGGADLPRELFLVDNGSTDETPALFAEYLPRFAAAGVAVTTWRNAENKGCSLARNEAWQKVTAPYTVLIDSDACVRTRDWLSRFLAHFAARPQLGILGPKLVYPYLPHKIQCAGVGISRLGRVSFRGRGAEIDDPRYGEYWSTWSLISACWMMRTDLRESVGYLDELFHPVQYEDLDLCLRAKLAGYEVAYTPDIEMYHFEGITTASFGQDEYKTNIARNSLKFRGKWHHIFPRFPDDLPAEEYRWLRRAELGLRPELDLAYA
ncbi:MAG: glycosyltransferase [Lentisphaeria bacterium]|jgi:GT2 family glycosyltransferase|nr:glycosyltransferase [Lentisphaeria bacterium]